MRTIVLLGALPRDVEVPLGKERSVGGALRLLPGLPTCVTADELDTIAACPGVEVREIIASSVIALVIPEPTSEPEPPARLPHDTGRADGSVEGGRRAGGSSRGRRPAGPTEPTGDEPEPEEP